VHQQIRLAYGLINYQIGGRLPEKGSGFAAFLQLGSQVPS
jgi:hypothetical protein